MKLKYFLLFFLASFNQASIHLPKKARKLATQNDSQPKQTNPTNNNNNTLPQQGSNDEALDCNREMLQWYGMTGFHKPQVLTHQYCPTISKNCCSQNDQIISMQLWTSENQYLVEKYYETYLFSIKFIIGYSVEARKIAEEFKSGTDECADSAKDLLAMNLNPQITQDIYKSYTDSLEELGKLRKGFYCILCDGRTQENLRDFWVSTNLFYKDRVYFDKQFCLGLVDKTIRSSYFSVFYLKRFAENLVNLMSCKLNNKKELIYDISWWQKQAVRNCYYFRDKYFYFFCEDYCQDFHLVKPRGLFDGEIAELEKFVTYIIDNKDKVFHQPNNNILMFTVTYEEDILEENFRRLKNIDKFFTSSVAGKGLDTFKTDVSFFGGMNPWESAEISKYPLEIAFGLVMTILCFISFGLLYQIIQFLISLNIFFSKILIKYSIVTFIQLQCFQLICRYTIIL